MYRSYACTFRLLHGLFRAFLLSSLVMLSSFALAAPIYFNDESSFRAGLQNAGKLTSVDFESLATFGSRSAGGRTQLALPGLTLSTNLPALKVMSSAYTGNRNLTQGGRQYLSMDTDIRGQGSILEMTFKSPLKALGFWLIDHDTSDAQIQVGNFNYLLHDVRNGEAEFFGLIFDTSLSIQSISIDTGQDGQVAMDDMLYMFQGPAAQVSEPPMLALVLCGFLILRFRRYAPV